MPNVTVYINKNNWEYLVVEKNKGGLVNKLLVEHYKGNHIDFKKGGIPNISDLKKRAIPDILVDIDTLKRQCAEELEYCQDPETRHSIEDEYKNRIQALWDEYKALKEAK